MDAGQTIERVYFPHAGVVSVVVGLAGGEMVEAAMVGSDSIVGGSAALDGKVALNKAIVQIGGWSALKSVTSRGRQTRESDFARRLFATTR